MVRKRSGLVLHKMWYALLVFYWLVGEPLSRVRDVGPISLSAYYAVLLFVSGWFVLMTTFLLRGKGFFCVGPLLRRPGNWLISLWAMLALQSSLLFIANTNVDLSYVLNSHFLLSALQEILSWLIYGISIANSFVFAFCNYSTLGKYVRSIRVSLLITSILLFLFKTRSLSAEVAVIGATAFFLANGTLRRFIFFLIPLVILAYTGSRMATIALIFGIALVYVVPLSIKKPSTWKLVFIPAMVIATAFPVLVSSPAGMRLMPLLHGWLRGNLDAGQLNELTQGRFGVWPFIYEHALERVVVGHGPGTASAFAYFVSQSDRYMLPHNEYLRVFHNYGMTGLFIFASFYFLLILYSKKGVFAEEGELRRWSQALFGSTLTLLQLFFTDNVGLYLYTLTVHALVVGAWLAVHNRSVNVLRGGVQ